MVKGRAAAHHANTEFVQFDEKTGNYVETERVSEYALGKVGEIVPVDGCRTMPAKIGVAAVPNAARDDISGTPTDFVTNAAGPVDIVFGPDEVARMEQQHVDVLGAAVAQPAHRRGCAARARATRRSTTPRA